MLIKKTKDMTDSERIAVENSNNQYLRTLTYAPVGMIIPFGGETVPGTFLVCDGSGLDTTEYADLFNAIGYTYGGSEDTFNIPNLSGATVNGISVKYIIKTANGIIEEERLKILANVDQIYNAESENAQSGVAVAEAVSDIKNKIQKLSVGSPPFSQAVIIKPNCTGDGDTDYDAKYIDDNNWSNSSGFAAAKGYIATRNDSGNLTTDTPTDDTECANKKYVDDAAAKKISYIGNTAYTVSLYAQHQDFVTEGKAEKGVHLIATDRTDGFIEQGGQTTNDFKEYAQNIVRRNPQGNISSGAPQYPYEVANKEYVDALKAEIAKMRVMIEELKGQ